MHLPSLSTPRLPQGHALRPHVLFRISHEQWLEAQT